MNFGRMGIGLGLGLGRGGAGGGLRFEAEAVTLFAAMLAAGAEPDDVRKGLINTRIAALKSAGLWVKKDGDWMIAAHAAAAARINWKTPGTFNLSTVNSPTFTTDRGYAGDGSTSYLRTNFNPVSAAGQFALNSAHLAVWSRTSNQSTGFDIGARIGASDDKSYIFFRNGTDNAAVYLNEDTGTAAEASSVTDSSGHILGRRSANNATALFRNGASILTTTGASQAMPNLEFYIGARNGNGVAGGFTNRQYAMASVGASLSDSEIVALEAIDRAFLQAIGAA